MKKFVLAFLLAVLAALCIQCYYNAKCISHQTDRAVITFDGVYCFVDRVELVKPYMLLRELEERDKKPIFDGRLPINLPEEQT